MAGQPSPVSMPGARIACGTGEIPDRGSFATVRSDHHRASLWPGIDQGSAEELDAVRTLLPTSLREGGSLVEIGQVLRHRHALTTAIYAKVDLDALRPLARPWPAGAR